MKSSSNPFYAKFLALHHPDKENIPFSTKPNKTPLTERPKTPLQPISLNGLKRTREEVDEPKPPQNPPKTIKFYKEKLKKNPLCDLCTSEIHPNSSKQSLCSHHFCNECSIDFLTPSGKCPLCSKKVKSSELSGEAAFDSRIKEALAPSQRISSSLKELRGIITNLAHKRAEKERIIYNDGSVYEGDFQNGKREGKGLLTLKTGEIYKSEWIDDSMQPIVEIIDPNGQEKYQGEVQGLQKHGRGVLTSVDFLFEGNWKDGKKHGAGILKYIDGSVFEGEWAEGQVVGFGTFTHKNGDVYKGEWTDLETGSGVIDFANGDEFIGSWWLTGNNKKMTDSKKEEKGYEGERQGVLVMANGVSIKGRWRNDKIQVETPGDF